MDDKQRIAELEKKLAVYEPEINPLLKINGKPKKVVAKTNLVRGKNKDLNHYKKAVYVVEVVDG